MASRLITLQEHLLGTAEPDIDASSPFCLPCKTERHHGLSVVVKWLPGLYFLWIFKRNAGRESQPPANVAVDESSGDELFDKSAMRRILQGAPFPALPCEAAEKIRDAGGMGPEIHFPRMQQVHAPRRRYTSGIRAGSAHRWSGSISHGGMEDA
jgi:hypothetical protein